MFHDLYSFFHIFHLDNSTFNLQKYILLIILHVDLFPALFIILEYLTCIYIFEIMDTENELEVSRDEKDS